MGWTWYNQSYNLKLHRRFLYLKNYVVYRHIGNLSKSNNGWVKELNFISLNNRELVYDIRTWNQDHTKYGKGIMITPKQMVILKKLLSKIDIF